MKIISIILQSAILFLLIACSITLMGCSPNIWATYSPKPPIEKTSQKPFENPNFDKQLIQQLISEVNDNIGKAYIEQTEKEVELVCIEDNNWEINTENKNMYRAGAKIPFWGSDDGLMTNSTFVYIIGKVNKINSLFGRFNDHLALQQKRPHDMLLKKITISHGLLVLYEANVLLSTIENMENHTESGNHCSFKPLKKYVKFVNSIVDEVGDMRLVPILQDMKNSGIESSKLLHYQVQVAVLSGKNAESYCKQAETTASKYKGQVSAWCGYYYYRNKNDRAEAGRWWKNAKAIINDPQSSAYSARRLQNIDE